jgi:hypothetical protein
MHYSLVRNITVIALLLFIIFSVLASSIINTDDQPVIMILLFVAATLGSIVNQSNEDALPLDSSFTVFEQSVFFAWKILVAIVFSLLLFYIFSSQIITGNLFPEFKGLDLPYKGTIDFLNQVKVQTNEDAAKLLVWSFIAGYTERFVPNIIQQVKGAV